MTALPAARAEPADPEAEAPAPMPQGDALEQVLGRERDALKDLFPLPPARPPRARSGKARRAGGALAALLVLVAAVGWIDPGWNEQRYAAAVGERREVALPDGSRLTLDSGSALVARSHLRSRRVVLESGRARFDVAHSALRPFEVAAGGVKVRVVGTVFDVDRAGPGVTVTVLQGRVEVSAADGGGAPVPVEPGQRLDARGDLRAVPLAIDMQAAAAWHGGQLVFRRTTLAEAVKELQRYVRVPIRVAPEVAMLEVSGVFEVGRADQMLQLLPRILPVRVSRGPAGEVDIGLR